MGFAGNLGGPARDADITDTDSRALDARQTAHEVLGQTHALLHQALDESVLSTWCPEELQDDLRATRAPLAEAIGSAHAAVASGLHDEAIMQRGLGGPLARPKRRTLRLVLEQLTASVRATDMPAIRTWVKIGAQAAETVIGSLAREIPGGEVISEAAGGIAAAVDVREAGRTRRDTAD